MNKVLYLKCITGGLDSNINSILGVYGLVSVNGKVVDIIDVDIKENESLITDDKALQVNGLTRDMISNKTRDSEKLAMDKIKNSLLKYIDVTNVNDRFVIVECSNIHSNFLKELFKRCNGKYTNYFTIQSVDILCQALVSDMLGKTNYGAYNLNHMCEVEDIYLSNKDVIACLYAIRVISKKLFKSLYVF